MCTNMAASMRMKPNFIEDGKDKQTGDYKSMENWHMVKLLKFIWAVSLTDWLGSVMWFLIWTLTRTDGFQQPEGHLQTQSQ